MWIEEASHIGPVGQRGGGRSLGEGSEGEGGMRSDVAQGTVQIPSGSGIAGKDSSAAAVVQFVRAGSADEAL